MMKKESKIQSEILTYLDTIGVECNKTSLMSRSGWPDIIGCYEGRFIGLEVKKPGSKATKLQVYKMDRLRKAGGLVGVVTSIKDVELLLELPTCDTSKPGGYML